MKTISIILTVMLAACGGGDDEQDVFYGDTRPCVYYPGVPGCAPPGDPLNPIVRP